VASVEPVTVVDSQAAALAAVAEAREVAGAATPEAAAADRAEAARVHPPVAHRPVAEDTTSQVGA
jgi:hypothetical protein